jgi:uncharacterized protein HemX
MQNARPSAKVDTGAGRGLLIAMLILVMIIAGGSVLVLRLNQRLVKAEVENRLGPIQQSLDEVRQMQRKLQNAKTDKEIDDALARIDSHLRELESQLGSRMQTLEGRAGTVDRKLDRLERQLLQLQAQSGRQ